MATKKAIYVDYSGVYELYIHPREYGMKWPKSWGSDLLASRYYPNPEIYEMVQDWRSKGALVHILTGGSNVESSCEWPMVARPTQAFDDVCYGDKSHGSTFDLLRERTERQMGAGAVRCCMLDDSVLNLAVASSAGWDAYLYDPLLATRAPGETIVRLGFQNSIAVSGINSS